jgi:secreted trypsin-like serine protease
MKVAILLALFTFIRHGDCESSEPKISGGIDVDKNAFPWMVSVRLGALTHLCGGAIVSDIFILTAASCFGQAAAYPILFTVVTDAQSSGHSNETTQQNRTVQQIILHPDYIGSQQDRNNLALVRLTSPWSPSTSNAIKISLSNLSSIEKLNLTVIGWGLTGQPNVSTTSDMLQQVVVQENTQCDKNKNIDPSTQICAEGESYLSYSD